MGIGVSGNMKRVKVESMESKPWVGDVVGDFVCWVGATEGLSVVGDTLGLFVGALVGAIEGVADGIMLGISVENVGFVVGIPEGA